MKRFRWLTAPFALLLAVWLPFHLSASSQKKQSQPAAKASAKGSPAKKQPTAAAASRSRGSAKAPSKQASSKKGRSTKSRRASRRPTQITPAPERIRAIQQALADRGYPIEPTGVWDARSVEALKKFQEDQGINNLTGRGKLDSLTLIALGLGPNHEPPQPPKPNPEGKQP